VVAAQHGRVGRRDGQQPAIRDALDGGVEQVGGSTVGVEVDDGVAAGAGAGG